MVEVKVESDAPDLNPSISPLDQLLSRGIRSLFSPARRRHFSPQRLSLLSFN